MSPELVNHPLVRADGSATFSSNLYTILSAVNGPVEVQRRDELPEEAAIEVNIRPSSGVGGPRERWLESVIASLLRSLLLVHVYPRTLIQVTLQVTKEPSLKMKRRIADISVIPALANAAFLAIADGGLPLERTMTANLGVLGDDGDMVVDPSEKQLGRCRSVHAVAYSAKGEMLLNESAGQFDIRQWHEVIPQLKTAALAAVARSGEDEPMMNGTPQAVPWMRKALEEGMKQTGSWRSAG